MYYNSTIINDFVYEIHSPFQFLELWTTRYECDMKKCIFDYRRKSGLYISEDYNTLEV